MQGVGQADLAGCSLLYLVDGAEGPCTVNSGGCEETDDNDQTY